MPETSDRATILLVVFENENEFVLGRVDARAADLRLIDALARLQLLCRRRGWRIALRDVPADLRGLLTLVGLAEVLDAGCRGEDPRGERSGPGGGVHGQPLREVELGEQRGEEEVVQPGDPPV